MENISLVFQILFMIDYANSLSTYYMTQTCNHTVSTDVGGHLEASYNLRYLNHMDCTFTISTSTDRYILLLTNWIRLEDKFDGVCVDYLNFYDGEDKTAALLNAEPVCGEPILHNYTSTGSSLTVHFVTDENAEYRGFYFTFSAFSESPCSADEFSCSDGLCLSSEVQCDGVESCGDGSDEETSMCAQYIEDQDDNTMTIIVICSAVGIVAIIATSIAVYKAVDYYRWQKWLKQNDLGKYPWEEEDDDLYKYPITYRYANPKVQSGLRSPRVGPHDSGAGPGVHNYRPESVMSSALGEANRPLSDLSSIYGGNQP